MLVQAWSQIKADVILHIQVLYCDILLLLFNQVETRKNYENLVIQDPTIIAHCTVKHHMSHEQEWKTFG